MLVNRKIDIHSSKLTWQWKSFVSSRTYIFKRSISIAMLVYRGVTRKLSHYRVVSPFASWSHHGYPLQRVEHQGSYLGKTTTLHVDSTTNMLGLTLHAPTHCLDLYQWIIKQKHPTPFISNLSQAFIGVGTPKTGALYLWNEDVALRRDRKSPIQTAPYLSKKTLGGNVLHTILDPVSLFSDWKIQPHRHIPSVTRLGSHSSPKFCHFKISKGFGMKKACLSQWEYPRKLQHTPRAHPRQSP